MMDPNLFDDIPKIIAAIAILIGLISFALGALVL